MAVIPVGGATDTTERTCRNCPSFLSGRTQTQTLSTNFSGPVCAVKMLPLIQPVQGPEASRKVLRQLASKCDSFGKPQDIVPLDSNSTPKLIVGMDSIARETPTDSQVGASCLSCVNYVDVQTVKDQTGWTGALCRATGSLMPDARLNLYAGSCGKFTRQIGVRPSDKLRGFVFWPQYDPTFGTVNPAKQYESSLDSFVDPKDYQTDRPVSDAMRLKRGIRAWRLVQDPKGYGEDVYLPIFDRDAMVLGPDGKTKIPLFREDQKPLIPNAGGADGPELYADHNGLLYTFAVLFMKLDETPIAWGMGGTGKTEIARWLAWLMQLPFNFISIDGSSEIDSIAGKMLFEGNETKPHYGTLPKGWSSPNVLLVDEPNTGPPEIWQAIRSMTDNRRVLILNHLKDERIERHIDCYPMMAANPQWSPLNIGAQMIGDADTSRLSHIFFDYPPRELEIAILQRRVARDKWRVPDAQMNALMNVADELRKMAADGVLHTSWGVRHQIKLARSLRWFDPVTAYKRAIGDALEPQQWDSMMTVIGSHFED